MQTPGLPIFDNRPKDEETEEVVAKYGKIIRKTWIGGDFQKFDRSTKLVLCYLWSCPDGAGCGQIFRISVAKIADDLGYTTDETREILESLVTVGWIDYDWDAKVVWLPRQLKEVEAPENANVVKGIIAKADELPRNRFRAQFESEMLPLIERFRNTFGTLPKWYQEPSRTPNPNPEPDPIPKPSKTSLSGKPDAADGIPYAEIVADLNEVTGRSFIPTKKDTRELIRARWKEGFRIEDFQVVHRCKYQQWGSDPERKQYLRPATLYLASKFEGYLQDGKSKLAEKKDKRGIVPAEEWKGESGPIKI